MTQDASKLEDFEKGVRSYGIMNIPWILAE